MKYPKLQLSIIIISLFIFSNDVKAQNTAANTSSEIEEKKGKSKFRHALGVGAGFTTGYGLSYRLYKGKFGAQVNFAPFKDSYTTNISTGLTFLFNLAETKHTSFYLYQGNHYRLHRYQDYYNSSFGEPFYYGMATEHLLNVGAGIGLEMILFKHLSFNLMTGFATYNNFEELNMTAETGLYYRF